MKILVAPPVGLGKHMSGGVYRTLQVYSRIDSRIGVSLCVDNETFRQAISALKYSSCFKNLR